MINVAAALHRYANLLELAELADLPVIDPYENDPAIDLDEMASRFRTGTAGLDLLRKALALQMLAQELTELGSIGDLTEDAIYDMPYERLERYALDFVSESTRLHLVGMLDDSYEL